jgi:DNA-binding IclR family transcriptional regulator
MLAVLDLFDADHPMLTVEDMVAPLACSAATAYRYVAELCAAGLLVRSGSSSQGSAYTLGPRIIELDYAIRERDRLLLTAAPVMRELRDRTGLDVLLTAMYGERIIAVHHERGTDRTTVSFGRGRPMPLFRGAGSKIILAGLPPPRLRRLFQRHAEEIAALGLGASWGEFRSGLAAMRKAGHAISLGELEPHNVGVAVKLPPDPDVLPGSLVAVLSRARWSLADKNMIVAVVATAAARIGALLRDPAASGSILSLVSAQR